jgi:hypothetical protein
VLKWKRRRVSRETRLAAMLFISAGFIREHWFSAVEGVIVPYFLNGKPFKSNGYKL